MIKIDQQNIDMSVLNTRMKYCCINFFFVDIFDIRFIVFFYEYRI